MDRRRFLAQGAGAMSAAFFGSAPLDLLTGYSPPQQAVWDAGLVRHLLPTVSDSRILIKASFEQPLGGVPTLRVGARDFPGRMNGTDGTFWQFYASGLEPGRRHELALADSRGSSLCEPWALSTFPSTDARPSTARWMCIWRAESKSILWSSARWPDK